MDFHRSTFANRIDFLVGLRFDVHVLLGLTNNIKDVMVGQRIGDRVDRGKYLY